MKQEAMQSDIRALMKLPAGRRVVWRLLEQAGVWRSVFNPEPLRMAFAEGQRNLGLWLLDWVMATRGRRVRRRVFTTQAT